MVADSLKPATRNLCHTESRLRRESAQSTTNWYIGKSAHWFIFIILLFAACNNPNPKPRNMLSDEVMVSALVELHLVEARANIMGIPQDSLLPLLETRYQEIFANLAIDTTAFNATFAYYEHNPAQMDSLYQKVVDNLVEREATYRTSNADSAGVPEPIAVDSVK
jgi:hypothetical protein